MNAVPAYSIDQKWLDDYLEMRLKGLKSEIFAEILAEESARLLKRIQFASVLIPIISIVILAVVLALT